METWALANQKGGTGKTTTAIHLAAALANRGKRCLLVDLDPQAHATLGLGIAAEPDHCVASTFLDGVPLLDLVRTTRGGFHLIPSSARLTEFEEKASYMLHSEGVLERAIGELGARYDWVLFDCPPRADGPLTLNAVRAAQTTLLVVETGAFAMQGALKARQIFEAAADAHGRGANLRMLATLFEPTERLSGEFLVALQARFGPMLFDTVIRRDEVLREAVAYGVPARVFDENSQGARDFDALAREVLLRPLSVPEHILTASCS